MNDLSALLHNAIEILYENNEHEMSERQPSLSELSSSERKKILELK